MMNLRIDKLPDATKRGQREIFAVESRLVTVRGKTVRNIVIFDNHPASLRLLLSSDLTLRRRNEFFYAVLTIALVLAAAVGMFWPLL
jgi:hypothetical protein